ncbi:8285_t:CDS:1, partial [Funneliformis mosseae]
VHCIKNDFIVIFGHNSNRLQNRLAFKVSFIKWFCIGQPNLRSKSVHEAKLRDKN